MDESTDRESGGAEPRRRSFLTGLLGTASAALAGAILYPVMRYISPPRQPEATTNRVLAAKLSELGDASWKLFPFGSEPGILVRTPEGEYRAFSAKCTHLACTVQYEEESRRIWCACHNGWYDLGGRVISGPPPHPLDRYEVNVVGDDVFVTRS